MSGHHLCRYERHEASKHVTITTVRDLSEAEAERVRGSLVTVATMTGNNLLKPLVDAANALAPIVAHVLERPSERANDFEIRPSWSAALDVWLMHLPLARRRLEREVRRALGPDAERVGKEMFERLYAADPCYRFAWEWRNVAQHELNPLELTKVTVGHDPAGARRAEWTINADVARHLPQFASDECRIVIDQESPCLEIVDQSIRACESVLCEVAIGFEEPIASAARLLFDLVAEVFSAAQNADGVTVSTVVLHGEEPESWAITPLRYDLAASALLTIDAAREQVGMPRAHTPRPEHP